MMAGCPQCLQNLDKTRKEVWKEKRKEIKRDIGIREQFSMHAIYITTCICVLTIDRC